MTSIQVAEQYDEHDREGGASGRQAAAAERLAAVLSPEAIDGLVSDAKESGMGLDGAGGLLGQMMKAVLERALQVEMADHLGYEAGDRAGRGSGNHRNGNRPVGECCPILCIDAVRVRVRDGGHVVNKAAHLVIGVDVDGIKNVLGIWIEDNEGAKFWLHVLTQLKNRGLADALIVCCDGLKGLPEAIEAVWPAVITQTCVVHLIRAAMKFVSSTDRKKVAAALKPVYTAVDETASLEALETLREDWGRKYPGLIPTFENAWDRFIPFLDFDQDIRRVIYTTNAIESMNRNLRKLIKTSGHFPSDHAAMKMLYLGIRNIEGRHIDGDGHVPAGRVRGTGTLGWTAAMNQFKIRFGDRLPL